ncbi:MAG: CinA family protein [Treponema sp.]|nr:CinA family protein [Treponema sp.]
MAGLFGDSEARAASAATRLVGLLAQGGRTLVLAESCTAGLVSDLVARVSGASAVLWGSFVCYSPKAKELMLGLDGGLVSRHGPVSREVAAEMAVGALRKAGASFSAAVTGLAGPLGDGSAAPVGTVWISLASRDGSPAVEREMRFQGSRAEVRMQAAAAVLEELLALAASAVD